MYVAYAFQPCKQFAGMDTSRTQQHADTLPSQSTHISRTQHAQDSNIHKHTSFCSVVFVIIRDNLLIAFGDEPVKFHSGRDASAQCR